MCFIDMNQFTVGQTVHMYGNTFKETLHKTNLCKRNTGHNPHTKIPFRSQGCSWISKPGHCEDNGHRLNSRFTFHKGDSSSVSRSIRTQRKTSDTGYNVHIIQSYVGILDSPDIRGNISKPFTRQRMNFSVMRFPGISYHGTRSSHQDPTQESRLFLGIQTRTL